MAVAGELPCGDERPAPHRPALLGYALSEGSLGYEGDLYLWWSGDDELADMVGVVSAFDNTTARIERHVDGRTGSIHPVRVDRARPSEALEFLFGECGLRGPTALVRRVPALVDGWDRGTVAVLVGKLFQWDGCIDGPTRSMAYATSSEALARDVQRLLLKLGLPSAIHAQRFPSRRQEQAGYTVSLTGGRDAFTRFQALVGPHLAALRQAALTDLVTACDATPASMAPRSVDVVPVAVCQAALRAAILKEFESLQAGCRALGLAYRIVFGEGRTGGIRRDTLRRLAGRLDAPALHALAEGPVAWSRRRNIVADGAARTFDFEVPGAQSFMANGVAVHNSHAAAYALVAYQTAYFKANYPVEFMAALLTSEMGDTDKIVKYMDECRAMGLSVRPPDVNASSVQFTVDGDTIRFGLAAIKNVGEAAIESILKTRAGEGSFTSLEDFCARVDLRLVNRRVVESLVKAGALDSLGFTRAHLLAHVDAALESGQRLQRDRADGQVSLFSDGAAAAPASAAAAPSVPVMPEWDDDQRLAFEKEVLGFYVSGHPLARYRELVDSMGVTPTSELPAKGSGAKVILIGHVVALKEIPTKSGNRMAFATLEDMDGTVEVTVFPEPFKAGAPFLRSREALIVRGRIDDGDKGLVVLAEDVRLLEQTLTAAGRPGNGGGTTAPTVANACRVQIAPGENVATTLAGVKRICAARPGGVPLFVHVVVGSVEVVVRAGACSVDGGPDLVGELEALLGPGAVALDR